MQDCLEVAVVGVAGWGAQRDLGLLASVTGGFVEEERERAEVGMGRTLSSMLGQANEK